MSTYDIMISSLSCLPDLSILVFPVLTCIVVLPCLVSYCFIPTYRMVLYSGAVAVGLQPFHRESKGVMDHPQPRTMYIYMSYIYIYLGLGFKICVCVCGHIY